jgi:branched-chain amino acid transport system substrate-binding protein
MKRVSMKVVSIIFVLLIVTPDLYAEQVEGKHYKFRFGMLLTLSGSYAIAGEDQRQGIGEALKEHALSSSVDVLFADSLNDPKTAISEFNKMILVDKVTAAFINRAKVAIPLNKISKENKIPVIGVVGHDDFVPANEYAFQAWPKPAEEGGYLAKKAIESGANKIAVLYAEDEYMSSFSNAFKDAVIALNGEVVSFESVLVQDFDIRSLILKIKNKTPDTIFINVSVPQIAPIVKQFRELGIKADILSNIYVTKQEVLSSASPEIFEGIRFVEINTELPTLKKSLGISENKSIPGLTVSSYVGMMLLLQASNDFKSGDDFYDVLLKQKEVITQDYTYKVEGRYIKFPLVFKKIENGNTVVIR